MLNYIMVIVTAKIKEIKLKLEIEESGKDIAKMQGALKGYKKFKEFMSAAGHTFYFTDDGDKIIPLKDMTYDQIFDLISNYERIKQHDWFISFSSMVESTCASVKNSFIDIDKARDVWYQQGFFKALTKYQNIISDVYLEKDSRDKEAERIKKSEPLFNQEENEIAFPDPVNSKFEETEIEEEIELSETSEFIDAQNHPELLEEAGVITEEAWEDITPDITEEAE